MKKILFLFVATAFLMSCQNEDDIHQPDLPPAPTNGGIDFYDLKEFRVTLAGDDLKPDETGTWSIHSGMVDDKVSFNNVHDPKTIFNGLPGEEYKLLWQVKMGSKTTTDTVKVHFSPLKTEILDDSHEHYQTRLRLLAKSYDKGKWTVEGNYLQIIGQSHGGLWLPDEESAYITFYGFENTEYKITWTTWYGSKSASETIVFKSGEYQQDEALEDLGKLYSPSYFKRNEAGDVTELVMNGDGYGWMFSYEDQFPALKALKHLTKLELGGNLLEVFPSVISAHYHKLEYLNLSHAQFTSIADDFGNLVELDTLILSTLNVASLPESFGELTKLRFLDMSGMGLKSLPESFSNLTSLNYLNMELNQIEKLPEQIGNLKNLETFRGPVLSQNIPNSFSGLSNLEFCFFTVTSKPAALPVDFGRLANLETLWLSGDYRVLPESFSDLSNLKDLSIRYGSGVSSLPENFGNLVSLNRLNIVVRLKELPASFTDLASLKNLIIHGELDNLPSDIGKMANLEILSAGHVKLKAIPESIGQLKKLEELMLSTNEIASVPASIGNLSKLTLLNLSRNKITRFPPSIANLAYTLRYLGINGNDYPEEELKFLMDNLPNTTITTRQEGD
ncbi:hypothetical protein P872_14275 [Rhodonellum psychrophilum GCM71 = DSM 17998]|uniref:Disease resistance R13L4/SHOC-2-like LRR domain-containing protein n=2 Tax=Rhodonellum TaxID=336827 RepID=U5BRQ6_9BACT|nr:MULTISPECIES: hypothetical protein [Rhodonellum]ERM80204.1 hypothetical protein P872_14275 [Rhodonellum psychrophilum GCM71 = DSM 17998]SDZ22630.1 Leucine-rich repeat (LRR) protein [Rhodonellum ikkaensis]